MDYRKEILRRLLDKYENSKSFYDDSVNRRITLIMSEEKDISDRLESADEKIDFTDCLRYLESENIAVVKWMKYEEGNLADRIYLVREPESLNKAYCLAGRKRLADELDTLKILLREAAAEIKNEKWIRDFFLEMLEYAESRHKIPRFFKGTQNENQDLIRALLFLNGHSQEEILMRVFSIRCFHDSKYFEKNVLSRLLSVIRYCFREENEGDALNDEELLSLNGIRKSPEIMEFCGNLLITMENGQSIDYSKMIYGAYMNSETADHIRNIDLGDTGKVTFIENKTNYLWYISGAGERKKDELVIYHGGCYSPVRGRWFQKIQEAAGGKDIVFRHASDIDAGGFRIFMRLKSEIIPDLIPYRMDVRTYEKYKKYGVHFDEKYAQILCNMLEDESYGIFHDVISCMLNDRTKIEQEIMI